MASITENFNGFVATDLDSNSNSQPWPTVPAGGLSLHQVSGEVRIRAEAVARNRHPTALDTINQRSSIEYRAFHSGNLEYAGPTVRMVADVGNWYHIACNGAVVGVEKYLAGNYDDTFANSFTNYVSHAVSPGDRLELRVSGTDPVTLQVYHNDSLITALGTAGTISDAAGDRITVGNYVGLWGFSDTAEQTLALDNFQAADLTSTATLSAATPSGTLGTQTTATIGATTDQNSGTLYVVVDSAANIAGISAAQVKAGNNNASAAAVAANSGAVSTTSPSVGVTGLTAGTLYSYAIVQNNTNGDSNVVTGTFTTAADTAVTISGLSDSTLTNGQTGVVITGTNFSASGNTVLISPTDDVDDVSAVAQTITAEGATEITITAVLGSFSFGATLYLFVVNGDTVSNDVGEAVSRVIASATLHFTDTNIFIDEGGDPVTATDLTFHVWRAPRPSGNPDQIITDVDITSGELSLQISPGSLEDADPVAWFVFDPDSENAQLFSAGVTNVTAG